VNWSETWQKLHQHGVDSERATRRLLTLGLRVEPLTAADVVAAARLRPTTRKAGLSLGDRCCLALADRLHATVITVDTAWATLKLATPVEIIR
jgi:PIN domain nuclease of toxin-antitoxin system